MTSVESIDRTTSPSREGYPPNETNKASDPDDAKYFLDDIEYFRGRLSDRLFSNQVNVDICCRQTDPVRPESKTFEDIHSLNNFLNTLTQNRTETVVVLKQRRSYQSLQITSTLFERLLTAFNVFPPFLDFIPGFRRDGSDECFNSYNCRYHLDRGYGSDGSYEFCYNIHYVARNGRPTGSPWSLRHMAVYEHHDSISGSSKWILVQPSDHVKARMIEYLGSDFSRGNTKTEAACLDPLTFHSAVFVAAERDWRDYINDLEVEMISLEEKALFSPVEKMDHSVTFSDNQTLQRFQNKLFNIRGTLESTIDVMCGYRNHCLRHGDANSTIFVPIDVTMTRLKTHKQNLLTLLERCGEASKLLVQIINYRNNDTLYKINDDIKQMTSRSTMATKAIASLTEDSSKDARSMKILTFIAMLYLPASLVAAVFSSNLVSAPNDPQGHFVIAKQFWIYPVVTIALMLLTLIPIRAWEEYAKKREMHLRGRSLGPGQSV